MIGLEDVAFGRREQWGKHPIGKVPPRFKISPVINAKTKG
jgi:hypothetical protein